MSEDKRHNDEVILAELRALKELLALEIQHIKEQVDEMKRNYEVNSKRISVIELWQSNSIGKMSVIMIAIGIGITVLTSWVTKHVS